MPMASGVVLSAFASSTIARVTSSVLAHIARVMLNPTILRKNLAKFGAFVREDRSILIKQNGCEDVVPDQWQ